MNIITDTTYAPTLELFTNSGWAGHIKIRKSTSGILFVLGKNPLQWLTNKQSCIVLSNAEAEYVSAFNASQELL